MQQKHVIEGTYVGAHLELNLSQKNKGLPLMFVATMGVRPLDCSRCNKCQIQGKCGSF